ncbi:tRNA (adenosine(37)-N6)-dimethylallyltransferase MiaA [Leeuwenhoekiella sp. A16]|uniref:tRNA (adenosine(37)-N6)-dimethylallyltransferase MiaA n=1 Tax=unclassified Leeuwenhoekiella TaxID=2615029 RepID=UPI003A809EA3
MTNYLITVVGPTAIGKTALGIRLANYFNTEVISADSRQFFKEMSIGTAVPSKEELIMAKHHFIQNISIHDKYNVGMFEREAISKLNEFFDQKQAVVMVGGSGLYVDAVIKGLDDFPPVKPDIRANLTEKLNTEGIESLQQLLKDLDPEHYSNIDLNNTQRLIRALEVCLSSGKSYSSFLAKNNTTRNFETIKIGLHAEREIIYDRINKRVDIMMQNGLEAEARSLFELKELNALQTVGYRELFEYFEGKLSQEEAISEIKKNTRRFAKRQLTWFRRDQTINWFDYETPSEEIIEMIKEKTSL